MKGGIEIDIWSSLSRFYSLSLFQVCYIMLCLIAIWTVIPVFSKCKIYRWWKKFNILSFVFSLLLIIKMTLWDRSVGFREVELRPFYTLTTISYNNEALRTLLMHIGGRPYERRTRDGIFRKNFFNPIKHSLVLRVSVFSRRKACHLKFL